MSSMGLVLDGGGVEQRLATRMGHWCDQIRRSVSAFAALGVCLCVFRSLTCEECILCVLCVVD